MCICVCCVSNHCVDFIFSRVEQCNNSVNHERSSSRIEKSRLLLHFTAFLPSLEINPGKPIVSSYMEALNICVNVCVCVCDSHRIHNTPAIIEVDIKTPNWTPQFLFIQTF